MNAKPSTRSLTRAAQSLGVTVARGVTGSLCAKVSLGTLLLSALSIGACDGGSEAPTFYADVAPIFAKQCVSCHQAGGIGPFVLDDADSARSWATAIRAAVEQRTMPPYLVTDDGSCGDYAGSGWLSDEEIETIAAWAEAGAPAGEASAAPSFQVDIPTLGAADMSVEVPGFTPAPGATEGASFDEYRCFLIHNDSAQDQFITAFEGQPDQAPIVHHMTVFAVDQLADSHLPGVTNGEVLAGLQAAADGRGGWPCFGAAGDGVAHSGTPAVWAPGQGVVSYPEGVGYRLRPGEDLVLQVHYNFPDASLVAIDHSRVAFRTADSVERLAWFTAPDDFLLSYILYSYGLTSEYATLPPGEAAAQFAFDYPAQAALVDGGLDPSEVSSFELIGVMPHMHELGRRQWLHLEDGAATDSCAMEVRRWDFGWQRFYFFEQGLSLDPTSQMRITCEWDTRGQSEPVAPGWGTDAEMCLITMMFAIPFDSGS